MSIITYPLNGVVYSAEDVATYLCTRTSGVYSKETNFAVSITGTRQITVAPGLAWINYDDFKGVSVCSREENVLTVPDADNTLNRVDRIVLQFDTSENITAVKLKTGTPAVAAQPPDILQNHNIYELGLCTISVPAGSSAVTIADITDTRTDEAVCGVMRDGVTGIPTGTLVQQWQAVLESMKGGSFYTCAETDALLDALQSTLQEQVDDKISSATSIAASGDSYIRFTDGTQICWGRWHYSSAITFHIFTHPVPFADTNYYIGTAYYGTASQDRPVWVGYGAVPNPNASGYYYDSPTTTSVVVGGQGREMRYIAVGRWK